MARHGQHGESDEQERRAEQGWRGQPSGGGQYDWPRESRSSRDSEWAEDSGFDQRGRYGNGRGEREPVREPLEDFAQRRGGPRQAWRGRGQASGSAWGPEQELGQGPYRGNRRSWEGEERGAYMDRQRDYSQGEFGGDPSRERGLGAERSFGGWSEQDRHGRGGMGPGWGPRGREQGWGEGEFGGFGRGSGIYGPGGEFGGRYEPGGMDSYGGSQRIGREPYGGRQGGTGSGGELGRGQFAGRGPKGYRRSDDRIKEDVCEQLTLHPDVDASEIEIEVQGGEVVLTGTVDSRQAKRLVEDLVETASGVKDVNNQLRVKRSDAKGDGHHA
jgi:hypothetical protein